MKTKITFFIIAFFAISFISKAQNNPTACLGATMVKIDTCYYLYGGQEVGTKNSKSTNALFLNSTYMFDRWDNSWTKQTTQDTPPGRSNHASASYDGKMYVFGGERSNGLTNDLMVYNPATKYWSYLSVSGDNILARKNASITIVDGKIYIAGGEDANGNVLIDAYVIDIATQQATQLNNMPGGSPTGNGAASILLNGKIYYFGGYNEYGSSSSLMSYDPATSVWYSFVNGFHTGFSGVVAINDMIAFVAGGSSTSKNIMSSELYKYNASDESKTLISSDLPADEYFNCFIYDLDTNSNKTTNDTSLYLWGGPTGTFYKYIVNTDNLLSFDTLSETWTSVVQITQQIKDNNISIFPNPAKNYIQIQANSLDIEKYNIFDINGKIIKQINYTSNNNIIDISNLPYGVYILNIVTKNTVINNKFIKE